ncbi:hypothetical protein ACFFQW_24300 [Umezawaea endophytica]|uniref:Uncharacterized protein n=1 Tax=Umezawaea endophytica TaxID=1654476 RepID=A0A9X3A3V5_9PSEU|nr:hypothetical protein [Umezawaea endophytica]MCS7482144.1 hypothetical protein [Umezawaea endophytica]
MVHPVKPRRVALLLGVIASLIGLGLLLSRTPAAESSEPPLGSPPADRGSAGPDWVAQQVPCTPGQGWEFSTRGLEDPVFPLVDAVRGVAGWARVNPGHTFVVGPNSTSEGYYEYTVDFLDTAGSGQFRVLRGPFEGTPVAVADHEANATGDCAPARRLVRPDGTVLQLYPVHSSEPFASLTQTIRVYTPGGMRYEVEMRNFGASALNGTMTRKYSRVGPGRETLPLDERRFAEAGIAFAEAVPHARPT